MNSILFRIRQHLARIGYFTKSVICKKLFFNRLVSKCLHICMTCKIVKHSRIFLVDSSISKHLFHFATIQIFHHGWNLCIEILSIMKPIIEAIHTEEFQGRLGAIFIKIFHQDYTTIHFLIIMWIVKQHHILGRKDKDVIWCLKQKGHA